MPAMSPAETIIKKFGGVHATARALGRHAGTISNWKRPRKLGGCAGRIPSSAVGTILAVAAQKKIKITYADILVGSKKK